MDSLFKLFQYMKIEKHDYELLFIFLNKIPILQYIDIFQLQNIKIYIHIFI